MTHADLVKIAERWLRNSRGCSAVLTELVTLESETPDAIGFGAGVSQLVECKTSRSDFLADAKKHFRQHPWLGVGTFRTYLCPEGIIQPKDLPEKWGLVWVNAKGKTKQLVGPKGNIWESQKDFYFDEKNLRAEWTMLISAVRRQQERKG